MHHRLKEILAEKQNEVVRLKKSMPLGRDMERQPLKDFKTAISIPQKINLTCIASIPLRSNPGNISFFLNFEGSDTHEKIAAVLKENDFTLFKI